MGNSLVDRSIFIFLRLYIIKKVPVLLVIMGSHVEQPEMGRLLLLTPEVLDEVFEDARILVELQKQIFVLFFLS